jgi:hypothetical protein
MRLKRLIALIVLVWLFGGIAVQIYSGMSGVLIRPYNEQYGQARDVNNEVAKDVDALADYMRALEQAGTPVSVSDRLALDQARLALAANAFSAANYGIAGYALLVGLWVGLLALALASAIAIAT